MVDPGVAETRRPLAAVAFNLVGDAWRGMLESRELPGRRTRQIGLPLRTEVRLGPP